MFVEHGLAEACGNRIDELIAPQNAADVAIVEDVFGSGQAERRSGDDHRSVVGTSVLAAVDLVAAIKNIGEQAAEFVVAIAVQRRGWCEMGVAAAALTRRSV